MGTNDHDRPAFRVDQIDHVELFVPDRREAAEWYRGVLGLTICNEYEHWADDPKGPLMISSDGGSTKLALFEGRSQEDRETAGFHLVAFRVSGRDFKSFLDRLDDLTLTDHHDRTVSRKLVQDHGQAFSVYFNDPYGHRLELTSYDVADLQSLTRGQADAATDPDADPSVEITAIEAGDAEPPSDVEETTSEDVLWMCHLCNVQLPAEHGLVCSRCYRSTCADCVVVAGEEEPVCKTCYE
jgi:catechol 2,3-dioxygenase-like lactoylglutathione lyase family enzyme